ncbi:nucleotidyl transferase AbiEii/AbiGii toxin family protein [Flavobacterium sp. xlx-214]|uniref:nucleotidyl transferase AbiEii/AbiGii toxin family protein n=1 Tax=unclassified Flavobacterium TaxID=196869 RepID=UPI0013D3FEB4|nr:MULTISPECIES: nucleotidyl transferase AbiEii/AbiGii toxin family protein [unclassified Flavobacterium]MBA5791748.1 nucleotidyl transferase AbiEii/AbiGii toxin family protein [Flavobacterium sp. xlx-221]QMI82987.1 nucleotidyl transferase AbiEii/AbiGii toxin family protein [Flavobacterium sp. xlx-214]
MKLHLNQKRFQEAIAITAQEKGIIPIYVEKDYWVTYVLKLIFTDPKLKSYTVFKGGTALSKCFDIIKRFSEDIDLTILVSEGETDSELKRKLRAISKKVEMDLVEINLEGITNKRGNIRKTAHEYPILQKGNFGQVRDKVIVEASWLGNFEPYHSSKITSFVAEMMKNKGFSEMITEYELEPFEINVLDVKRTFCEKIMSLVRFSFSKYPIEDLKNKIRHIYDLNQLLELNEIKEFLKSDEFNKMMIKVGKDDIESYKNDNKWLDNHPKESILFTDLEKTWDKIKESYLYDFKLLVFGDLPKEENIIKSLKTIRCNIVESIRFY